MSTAPRPPSPSPSPSTEVVARFWDTLYARDWAGIKAALRADSVYWDVPTGPTTAAQGPDAIEARLRLGLDTLSGYDHGPATIVADGPVVMTEHAETWHWESVSGGSTTPPASPDGRSRT